MDAIPASPELAGVVRGRRHELEWTQDDLSKRLGSGWSLTNVRRLEGGAKGLRNEGELAWLAKNLDLTSEELLERLRNLQRRGGDWGPDGQLALQGAHARSGNSSEARH